MGIQLGEFLRRATTNNGDQPLAVMLFTGRWCCSTGLSQHSAHPENAVTYHRH